MSIFDHIFVVVMPSLVAWVVVHEVGKRLESLRQVIAADMV